MASEDATTAGGALAKGDWHPAGSSRSTEARLVERAGELAVVPVGGEKPLAGAGLSWVEISGRVGSIPRRVTFPDGSVFETWDNDGIDRYLAARGKGGAGLVHWLEQFRLRLIVIVLAAFALGGIVYRWGVPVLVEVAVLTTPPIVPQLMSQGTLQAFDKTTFSPTKLSEEKRKEIADGFARIAAQSPRGAGAYNLNFRDGGLIGPNAFALPDGRIFVTDELVELAASDEEVLAVLAHEAGHHVHRHGMRGALESSSVFVVAGLLFGDVSGSSLAVSIPATLLTSGFSRGYEREADAYAFDLLRRRGQSPKAFAAMMRRLSADVPEALEQGAMGYLSTHPPSPERIAEAERAAAGPR